MFREFKAFAMRGNVLDMAVGVVIGASFGAIVSSLVADVIMPPIGLVLGNVDFANLFLTLRGGATPGPYASLADARDAGAVTVNYGAFLNAVASFLIVAFVVFVVVRAVNRMKRAEVPPAPATKECPFCAMAIPVPARRCPQCTSTL